MKKAILISGIIWGVLAVITGIIFLAVSPVFGSKEVIDEVIKNNPDITREAAEAAAAVLVTTFAVIGGELLAGGVFSFVLAGVRNKGGKGAGIALGIVGIVLGAILPGIFTLIDAIKNR